MVRWEAGTRQRLQRAALSLFAERGYDGVTVAEIAAAAGLTERTFFRWFSDKREVLFTDEGEFEASFLSALSGTGPPLLRVEAAVLAAAAGFPDARRELSRARQRVIDADPRLRERELLKLAALAAAIGRTLEDDGVGAVAAGLAAEQGVAVFRIAFARWLAAGETRAMTEIVHEVAGAARALNGAPG